MYKLTLREVKGLGLITDLRLGVGDGGGGTYLHNHKAIIIHNKIFLSYQKLVYIQISPVTFKFCFPLVCK